MKAAVTILLLCISCHFAGAQTGNAVSFGRGDDTASIRQLLEQGHALMASQHEKAAAVADDALRRSEKIGYTRGQSAANMLLGQVLFLQKSYTAALEHFEKSKVLYQQAGDEFHLGQVYKYIADVYARRNIFRLATENYREAVALLRKTNQLQLMTECQDAFAKISLDFGRYRGAINIYQRSLQVKKMLNDTKGIMAITAKLADACLGAKLYDSALYYNDQVKEMSLTGSSYYNEAVLKQIIIYSLLGHMDNAGQTFRLATAMVNQLKDPADKADYYVATLIYYTAMNDTLRSRMYMDSASRVLSGSRNIESAFTGLGYLAELHSNKGHYKEAFEALRMAGIYKDVLRNETVSRMSAEASNASEIVLQEKQIEYLNLVNKLKAEQLSKEELQRLSLLRENILKDSSLANQQLLMEALESESALRQKQLEREQELSQSLSRENELKATMLLNEKRNKGMLLTGIGLLLALAGIIFFQYRRQKTKNNIIRKQSGELQVLNKEIHHRVKNNLQVISSMLDLQSQTLQDEKATAIIREGMQRVQSMAFIHQNLYQGSAANGVNMNEYIRTLSLHLFQTYNIRMDKIRFHTAIEELNLHTDTAIPLGMIMNELVSNSLKYAFRHREEGDIWVNMRRHGNELLLQVKDNGEGLPADFNPEKSGSFGYEIINAFCQKMKARLNVDGSDGTDVQIIVSKFKTTG